MAPSFADIILSDQFKFLVGEDKTPIVVHSRALAATSAQIDRLINGHMKEATTGCTELPDIRVDDFIRFCEFAYRGDYTTPACDIDEAQLARRKARDARLAEKSKQPPNDFFAVPPPPETQLEVIDWSSFTVPKPKSHPSKKSAFRTAYSSRIYLPRDSPETNATRPAKPQINTLDEQDFTPIFLAHARLYVFAHVRMIDRLGDLTLDKLHKTLLAFQLFDSRVGDVVALARYAYAHEDIPSRGAKGRIDRLRDLVVNYIASEVDVIGKTAVFESFLEEGGEFVSDFLGALRYLL